MTYETFEKLEAEVRQELQLVDEPILTQAAMISAANDAISKAEKSILTLYEDYYRTSDYLRLVTGKSDYDMPADIHAVKLRGVIYNDGSSVYPIRRVAGQDMFVKMANINLTETCGYRYDIENASTDRGMRFVLYPASEETSSRNVRRWYIRKAARICSPGDLIDVPEGYDFVKAFVKHRSAMVEPGLHDIAALKEAVDDQFELLISTLASKTPDEDNQIPMDTSFYDEHV